MTTSTDSIPRPPADGVEFPADFLWGAATSAYQVEGSPLADGAGPSIWHRFAHTPGRTAHGDNGDVACDHYHRWPEDLDIARGLGANVIAFGHTADDFCESFLRNALFTGRLSALPAVTYSSKKEFRLICPLVFVSEEITRKYAESLGAPVIPCGCSQRTGTVRRSLRDFFAELEQDYPHLKENMLSAMGNIEPQRLLDVRYLNTDLTEDASPSTLFPIVTES